MMPPDKAEGWMSWRFFFAFLPYPGRLSTQFLKGSEHMSKKRNLLVVGGSLVTASLMLLGAGNTVSIFGSPAAAAPAGIEKPQLKLGFIKLTDMVPLAIAKEMRFFEQEGLSVTLEPQSNWKVLLDGVISGQLDGAHMLAGQPIAASIGYGTAAKIVTPLSLDLNGNACTVSNKVWGMMKPSLPKGKDGKLAHPISAKHLKPVVTQFKQQGKPFKMGMVFPVSTHNYELRYWLAAGGLNPGYYTPGDITGTVKADVQISVTPPPQMPATLEAGTIDGYCVGEPWNQAAVFKKIGVPVVTDHQIQKFNPEKVLGLRADFVQKYPKTTIALVKAIIRAQMWLDASMANRKQASRIISQPNYVGADVNVIDNSMTGTFTYEANDTRPAPDFNIFFKHYAGYPYYSDAVWYLTQMRRWGQIPTAKADGWYINTAKSVYLPGIYMQAAAQLVKEGKAKAADFPKTNGFKGAQSGFIDGVVFDGSKPNAYLSRFPIGLKGAQTVSAAGVK
jgi:nitrate/nitrite transport system substrate-binding protein